MANAQPIPYRRVYVWEFPVSLYQWVAFFFNFLVRIYWEFVGNDFARWTNFMPFKKAH